jgi:hypothetical protein
VTAITPDHSDKHGTFTNGEQRFTGTVSYVGPVQTAALIDGTSSIVIFPRDNWDFTPDPDPLPTIPGIYLDDGHDIWSLSVDGEWALIAYANGTRVSDRNCRSFVPAMHTPLIRLVKERAK